MNGLGDRFINAGIEMGYKKRNLNAFFGQGFDHILSPLKRGCRQSTATAYLNNAIRSRSNLDIRKFAEVQKVYKYSQKHESFTSL